ncbi:AaceriAFR672Cp [[Ashbya] aceris (nom. inval.)]|nr:AaceriAFR672Cp [[Ashbya] aceris (nom. inval.)]
MGEMAPQDTDDDKSMHASWQPEDTLPQSAQHETFPLGILKARVALLATAIGGPDHTSEQETTPYKIGDDCLACLKDLKRWFVLVDQKQKRWDVASAAAEFRILEEDLIPILVQWEQKMSQGIKQSKASGLPLSECIKNKQYHGKIALNAFQLMVWMTWPLSLNEESSKNQVHHYADLKKHQLAYKKAILQAYGGKVVKAAVRIATEVIKIDRLDRSVQDNSVLRLVLNFLRNILAIEPSEVTVSAKQLSNNRNINTSDMLPPNISIDDICLNSVVSVFKKYKVFPFLLTISSSMGHEFDAEYVSLPLLEVAFYLTKDVDSHMLNSKVDNSPQSSQSLGNEQSNGQGNISGQVGMELIHLLDKDRHHRMSQIRSSSTRHSRFGGFFSIQTPNNGRLTISNGHSALDNDLALQNIDKKKKWNKTIRNTAETVQGIPIGFLNGEFNLTFLSHDNHSCLKLFLANFVDSSFNILLKNLIDYFTVDEFNQQILQKLQFLLFYAWFLKFERDRCQQGETDGIFVSEALQDTSHILIMKFLREAYELKKWPLVHAAMLAVTELLNYMNILGEDWEDDVNVIYTKIFSNERLKLFSTIPRTASRHSLQYVKACINMNHAILTTLERFNKGNKDLVIKGFRKRMITRFTVKEDKAASQKINGNKNGRDVSHDANEDEVSSDEDNNMITARLDFMKVLDAYFNGTVIDTYMFYLKHFTELNEEDIKKVLYFLNHIIDSNEESFLFRVDFMILLKEMLAPGCLHLAGQTKSRLNAFSDRFMTRLKRKLEKSPFWYINILFPNLHDRELGYYLRYGQQRPNTQSIHKVVAPTQFKYIEGEENMSEQQLKDMRIGILVSTLLDDGKNHFVEEVKRIFKLVIEGYEKHYHSSERSATLTYPRVDFRSDMFDMKRALLFDSDLRALLTTLGYHVAEAEVKPCYIGGEFYFPDLSSALNSLEQYMELPFHTPNGLPSSSYLLRSIDYQSRADADAEIEETMHADNNSHEMADAALTENASRYFDDLERMEERLEGKQISRGTAKKRSAVKPRSRKSKSMGIDGIDPHGTANINKSKRKKQLFLSSEFISDSDEDDELVASPIFYENEIYLRYILDKHQGNLPPHLFSVFSRFANERRRMAGTIVGDYTDLFKGPVPSIEELKNMEDSTAQHALKDILQQQPRDHLLLSPNSGKLFALSNENLSSDSQHDNITNDIPLSDSEYNSSNSSQGNTAKTSITDPPSSKALLSKSALTHEAETDSDDEFVPRKRTRKVRVEDGEE